MSNADRVDSYISRKRKNNSADTRQNSSGSTNSSRVDDYMRRKTAENNPKSTTSGGGYVDYKKYGYQTREAYDADVKKYTWAAQNQGMSYADVLRAKKNATGDELNYLNQYGTLVGYNSLADYDAELANTEHTSKLGVSASNLGKVGIGRIGTVAGGLLGGLPGSVVGGILGNQVANKLIDDGSEGNAYYDKLLQSRNLYEAEHKFDQYSDIMNADDFDANSGYKGNGVKVDAMTQATSGIQTSDGIGILPGASVININKNAGANLTFGGYNQGLQKRYEKATGNVNTLHTEDTYDRLNNNYYKDVDATSDLAYSAYDKMTEDELKVFNYIYNTQGKEAAQKYLEDMNVLWERRRDNQLHQGISELADSGFGGNALLTGGRILAAQTANLSSAMNIVGGAIGGEYDAYNTSSLAKNFADYSEREVGQNLNEAFNNPQVLGVDVPSFLYSTALSSIDSYIGAATLGSGYSVLMGTGAFQTTAKDLADKGATQQDIWIKAGAAGIAEIVTEHVSLESLEKIINDRGLDTAKKVAMAALRQAGYEGSEEVASDIINHMVDEIYNGKASEMNQTIQRYMEEGMTEEEARSKAYQEFYIQMGESFLGGALSGGGAAFVGGARQYNANNRYGASLRENNNLQYIDEAAQNIDKESQAFKDYSRLVGEGTIADANNAQIATTYRAIGNQLSDELRVSSIKDIENLLSVRGMEAEEAKVASKAIYSLITNKSTSGLSRAEIKSLNDDRVENFIKGVLSGKINVNSETTNKIGNAFENLGKANNMRTIFQDAERIEPVENGYRIYNSDGTTNVVQSENVDVDESEIMGYVSQYNESAQSIFLDNYRNSTSISAFDSVFGEVYDLGKRGENLTNKEIDNYASVLGSYKIVSDIYKAGNQSASEDAKRSAEAIDKAIEGFKAENFKGGKFKSRVEFKRLNKKKQTLYKYAQGLSALGLNVEVIDDKSAESLNGQYNKATNSITINLSARLTAKDIKGERQKYVINTFAHELTHYLEENAKEAYAPLKNMIKLGLQDVYIGTESVWDTQMKEEYDAAIKDGASHEEALKIAESEVIARACEDVLNDNAQMVDILSKNDSGLLQTIRDAIMKFFDKFKSLINKLMGGFESGAIEAQAVREIDGLLDEMRAAWADAFTQAIAKSQMTEKVEASGGIKVDTETGTVVSDFNSRKKSYANEWQNMKHKVNGKNVNYKSYDECIADVAKTIAEKANQDAKKVEEWIKAEESISAMIMREEYADFLDYEADDRYQPVKKNSDYPQGTFDLSNLCRKREIFTKMFDALQRDNAKVLFDADDLATIRQVLAEEHYEVACALCYVEDRRQNMGEIAKTFIGYYKDALKSKDKLIFKINSEGDPVALKPTKDQRDKYHLPDAQYKATDKYIPTQYDLVTYEGFKTLQEEHPTIAYAFERYNNSRGMASARVIEGHAEYARQVLGYTDNQIAKINSLGGLRVFSFSDFEAMHLIDTVQIINDCAKMGIKIQAYTKVPEFAHLVRNTRMKVNRSLIAANVGSKNAYARVIENGKVKNVKVEPYKNGIAKYKGQKVLAFDIVEGIDITNPHFLDESDEIKDGKIVKRGNPNIGNILVGCNDEQIQIAMTDPFIDYIIPFHTGQRLSVLHTKGIGTWDNYKDIQEDRKIGSEETETNGKKKKKTKGVNIYDLIKNGNVTNKYEFFDAFIKAAEGKKLIPRFDKFIAKDDNGNYQYTEGYWKMLLDFKLFDAEGNILPQETVVPVHFEEEGHLENLVEEIFAKDVDREKGMRFDKEINQKIKDALKGKHDTLKSAKRDSNGNVLTEEQAEYFKDSKVRDKNGNLLVMYHGTANTGRFNQFEGNKLSNETRTSQIGQGFYFTNDSKEAEAYTNNVDVYGKSTPGNNPYMFETYLNITNPFDVNNDKLDIDKVKKVVANGNYDWFFDNYIAFYLNNKIVNGIKRTKQEINNMSKEEKASLFVDFYANNNRSLLREMVRAYKFDNQELLLENMKSILGYDGIVDEFAEGKYQYVAFSSEQIKDVSNTNPTSNPDIRYSTKRDSEGKTLTKAQEEFFKDSKVRDENGNLMVMYHGTDAIGFNVFDPEKADDKISMFFTNDIAMAQSYAENKDNLYKVYLDIKNPMIVDANGHKWNDIALDINDEFKPIYKYLSIMNSYDAAIDLGTIFESVGDLQSSLDYLIENDEGGYLSEYSDELHSLAEEIDAMYEEWDDDEVSFEDHIRDIAPKTYTTRQLSKKALDNGYDGLIVRNVYDNGKHSHTHGVEGFGNVVVAFNSNQIKSVNNTNPTRNADIRYSTKVGYHAGDLGKSESLAQQGYGRDTGHFGTGTYFVSNPKAIEGYNSRNGNKAPVETVDFSKYNLYKVSTDRQGYRLHDFLRFVDGYYNINDYEIRNEEDWERRKDDLEYAISEESISKEDAFKEALNLFGEYEVGRRVNENSDIPENMYINYQDGEFYMIDQSDNYKDVPITYEQAIDYIRMDDLVYSLISDNRYAPKFVDRIERFTEFISEYSDELFGLSEEEVYEMLDDISKEIKNLNTNGKTDDSAATRFMKRLGYEGIDVGGTGLDNTAYGSVIYDLKGEDLARKNEIGTARYSTKRLTDMSNMTNSQIDEEYMDAVNSGDMVKAKQMVEAYAQLKNMGELLTDQVRAYTIRTKKAPTNTIKVYKTFTLDKQGRPSALFVSSTEPLPVGVWLDANDTYHFTDQSNGHMYVPSTKNPNTKGGATGRTTKVSNLSEEDKKELIKRGYITEKTKSITSLAYRPGWHAGDLPFFPQGGTKIEGSNYENVHRFNQVVYECEMAYDIDYTRTSTNEDGNVKFYDMQEMPVDGGYKFATNPMAKASDIGAWYISGSLKIVRALTEDECNEILSENGRDAQEWQIFQDDEELKALKKQGKTDAEKDAIEKNYQKRIGRLDLDRLGYDPNYSAVGQKTNAAVTYDDNGNVIPLTQRFDSSSQDIRYSTKRTTEQILTAENERLKADIKSLRELVRLQGKETNGFIPTKSTVEAAAKAILKSAVSTYDRASLERDIANAWTKLQKGNDITEDIRTIADNVVNDIKEEREVDKTYKTMLKNLRATRVRLTTNQIAYAKQRYGNRYRDLFMGKVILANDGTSLDALWERWTEKYPDVFQGMAEEDMVDGLLEAYETIKEASEKVVEIDTEYVTNEVMQTITEKMWNIAAYQTVADKYAGKIKGIRAKHRKEMDALKKARDEQKLADEMHYKKLLAQVRAQRDERINSIKEFAKMRKETERERAERKRVIDKIERISKNLRDRLLTDSAKKNVPVDLKVPVLDLLNAIDTSSQQLLGMRGGENAFKPTNKDISIAAAMAKLTAQVNASVKAQTDGGFVIDLPGDYAQTVADINAKVADIQSRIGDSVFVLQMADRQTLNDIADMLEVMLNSVRQMNSLIASRNKHSVDGVAREIITEAQKKGERNNASAKAFNAVDDFINKEQITPYYFFKHLGSGGIKIFEELQDGFDKYAFHIRDIVKYSEENWTGKQVKEWTKTIKDFDVKEVPTLEQIENGEEGTVTHIQMTIPQIMSLYCLNKREQARKHIEGFGIKIAEFKNGAKTTNAKTVTLTEDEVTRITSVLTDEQIKVADAIQTHMNTVCKDWMNEITMKRFGIIGALEENYFPIKSDSNSLDVPANDTDAANIYRLLNMSFTKQLNENANNAIVVGDIFTVFTDHATDMAKYNAVALPTLDLIKVLNYKEVEKTEGSQRKGLQMRNVLDTAYGRRAVQYITKMLTDLNGGVRAESGSQLITALNRNYKIAAVGANLQVAVLQGTSAIRAGYVIDPKYIARGYARRSQVKKVQSECGISAWKQLGFYQINVNRGLEHQIRQDDTVYDKITDASMKGAEFFDNLTWGYLYNACEEWARGETDYAVDSKEFRQAVNDKFREVVYATQVVDSTLTRSDYMRKNDWLSKSTSAFMAEPTLTYNMVYDAFNGFVSDIRKGNTTGQALRNNGQKIARAMVTFAIAAALESVLRAGISMLRKPDDDENYAERLRDYFLSELNPLSKIPIFKDILEILQGYSVDRMEYGGLKSAYDAFNAIRKSIMKGEHITYKEVYNTINATSQISGVAASGAMRDVVTLWNTLCRIMGWESLILK